MILFYLFYLPSFIVHFRTTSALSGSASLLSGSLSKIFRSFLTHPGSCLNENEKPKSLQLLLGNLNSIDTDSDRPYLQNNSEEKNKSKNKYSGKNDGGVKMSSEKEKKNFARKSFSDSGKSPGSAKYLSEG